MEKKNAAVEKFLELAIREILARDCPGYGPTTVEKVVKATIGDIYLYGKYYRALELAVTEIERLNTKISMTERERDDYHFAYDQVNGLYGMVSRENAEMRQAIQYAMTGENADEITKQNGELQKRLEEQRERINDLANSLNQVSERMEAAERVCMKAVIWGSTRHTTPKTDKENCPGCKATGELVDELEKWFEAYGKPKEQGDGKEPNG
jgi:hypothetical protein